MAGRRARGAVAAALLALCLGAPASAEVVQEGNLRVSFTGGISPSALPRQGRVPVEVEFGGEVKTTDGLPPPQLRSISLSLNRNGKLDYRGVPACRYHQIHPASTREAVATCPRSVIGTGAFSARVLLPEQSPFPSTGRVTAFNGIFHGRRVIFAHVFGTSPLPQSQVLIFEIGRASGAYRTTLTAELPRVAAEWGYVSGVSLALGRVPKGKGRARSFVSAGCPAPADLSGAVFAFARASFGFEDGRTLGVTMTRSCKVKKPSPGRKSGRAAIGSSPRLGGAWRTPSFPAWEALRSSAAGS